MANEYRYILERYKGKNTRYKCPHCGANRSKTFVRYIDTYTGLHVADDVGKCDRENNCGYHYTPYQYFKEHGITPDNTTPPQEEVIEKPVPISYIPNDVFKQSLTGYNTNSFIKYLNTLFDADTVTKLIARYFLGSTIRKQGGVIFWQVDAEGNIRTGKIMNFNPDTGKRLKEDNQLNWVHSSRDESYKLIYPEYNLQQCFFGEHLLKEDKTRKVAIVESEKTAIIASVYMPDFIWLAAGGIHGLNAEKFKSLKNRDVILFPDINAYDVWLKKARDFSGYARIKVSDYLERNANDEQQKEGLDIADFLVLKPIKEIEGTLKTPNISTHVLNNPDTLFNYIAQSRPEPLLPLNKREPKAFIGHSGKLYIRQSDCPSRYAMYDSAEAYNKRLHLPYYENELFVMQDFKAWVEMDFNTLTVEIGLNP